MLHSFKMFIAKLLIVSMVLGSTITNFAAGDLLTQEKELKTTTIEEVTKVESVTTEKTILFTDKTSTVSYTEDIAEDVSDTTDTLEEPEEDTTEKSIEDSSDDKKEDSDTVNKESSTDDKDDSTAANADDSSSSEDKKSDNKKSDETKDDETNNTKDETNETKETNKTNKTDETKETNATNNDKATSSDISDEETLDANDSVATMSDIEPSQNISTASDVEPSQNISTSSDIQVDVLNVATNSDTEIHYNGYIPETLITPIPKKNFHLFGDTEIPAQYDARNDKIPGTDLSIVPPTRDQGGHSTCWAFATIGLIETNLRKKGLVTTDEDSNLSELALAYFTYNMKNITSDEDYLDTPGLEGNDYSKIIKAGEDFDSLGGNIAMASILMSSYAGVVKENQDSSLEYTDDNFNNPPSGEFAFNNNAFEIKNVLYLNKNDRTSVKKAIKEYGAVGISFFGDGSGKNASQFDTVINGEHYHFPYGNAASGTDRSANHAIIIVGWDDTIPASNFVNNQYHVSPSNPGGWLCKNSWGNYSNANNGFFWMSYDEPSIRENMYAIEAMEANTYDYNYHYDTTLNDQVGNPYWSVVPKYNYYSLLSNIFKSGSNETLDAVNVRLGGTNSVFDILVYTNDKPMSNPTDGTLKLKKENVSKTYPGIYTIEFEENEKVYLAEDTYYSIIISDKCSSGIVSGNNILNPNPFTVGYDFTYNDGTLQHINDLKEGQSFYGYTNNTYANFLWEDNVTSPIPIENSNYQVNWRIKGLTNPAPVPADAPDYYVFAPDWFDSSAAGITKSNVESITFLRYGDELPSGSDVTTWNLPASSNGLKGYKKGNDIYVYAEHPVPIKMAENASYLFSDESSTSFVNLYNINNLNYLDTSDTTNMKGMFSLDSVLRTPNFSKFNTSKVTDMSKMFFSCKSIGSATALDLSSFDTKNVTTMESMFSNCLLLSSVNVSSFDTSKVTNMNGMFNTCITITSLDLSHFNTSNVTDMSNMFSVTPGGTTQHDSYLKSLNVSNFDTSKVTDMSRMFARQRSLKILDLRSFDTSHVTNINQMFNQCENLTKILASNNFVTSAVTNSSAYYINIFGECASLKGGNGTVWSEPNSSSLSYARVDGGTTAPGYFSSDYDYDYILSPGWYSSAAATAMSLNAEDIETIEIITYGIGNEPSTVSYDEYELSNTSNNTYGKNLKLYGNQYSKKVIIYAPKLDDAEDKPVTIKLAADSSFLFSGNLTGYDSTIPPIIPRLSSQFTNLKSIVGLEHLHTHDVTSMRGMFYGTSNLESLNISSFDTSKVTDMALMFSGSLKNVNELNLYGFDTSHVTNFHGTFMDIGAKKINLSSFNTSAATDMSMMFCDMADGGLAEIDLSGFDTSGVTTMLHMISAPSVSTIDVSSFDTSNVTDFEGMFWNMAKLTSLDVSNFNTSHATSMRYMFWGCKKIDDLSLTSFNTRHVTNIENMFEGCKKLATLDISSFNTSATMDMSDMFNGCESLTIVKASPSFIVPTGADTVNMFKNCVSINGGSGTTYDKNHIDGEYARIDGGTTAPGYFTGDTIGSSYSITYQDGIYNSAAVTKFTKIDESYMPEMTSQSVLAGNKVIKPHDPVASKAGYTEYQFKGWYKTVDLTTGAYSDPFDFDNEIITGNITLYAKWEIVKTITFHFDLNASYYDWESIYPDPTPASIADVEVESGNKLTKPSPDPTWDQYFKFKYWYETDEDTPFNFDDIIPGTSADDRYLFALWVPLYPVHFVVEKYVGGNPTDIGAVAIPDVYIEENGKLQKPSPDPEAPNHRFDGWYTTLDPATDTYSDPFDFENDIITSETYLYAKWSDVQTITFNYNMNGHGASINSSNVPEGSKLTKPATPSETGWKFKYWYETDPETEFDFNQVIPAGSASPRTLNAKWEAIKYYIQYDVKNGTFPTMVTNPFTKTYGSNVTLATPSKVGYEFDGWYENYDASTDSYTDRYHGTTDILDVENDTKIIYAKWNENSYPITLHDDGGTYDASYTVPVSRLYTEEITLPTPSEITKTGYVFKGWYGNDEFTGGVVTKIPANTEGPHEYWLKWNELHTIHFDVRKYDGSIATDIGVATISDVVVEDGNKLTKPTPDPVATGYIFRGWYYYTVSGGYSNNPFNFDTEVVEEEKYLFAKWEPITYEVTYHTNNGTLPSGVNNPFTKTYDSSVTLATPSKTGYEFVHWYKEDTLTNVWTGNDDLTSVKDDDKDIYAKWNPITYKIKYNLNGVNATTPSEITKTYDDDVTLSDPTNIPSGYEFLGWFKEAGGVNPYDGSEDLTEVKNDDQTIYAKWRTAIVFNANGHGTAPASIEITGTQTINLPDITATGYTFGGWYDDADINTATFIGNATDPVTVSSPTTYYAKWTANKYYVKYVLNSTNASLPAGVTESFEKTYDTNVTLATPSQTGYEFVGWYKNYTAPDTYSEKYEGTNDLQSTNGDASHPVEIYAKWSANTYKIIYNIGTADATTPSDATKTYDSPLTLSNPTNIGDGWTFVGWYKESSLTNPWTGNDDLTSTSGDDKTIYAKWKAKITYNTNGHGTTPAAVDVELNATTPLPTLTDVEGFTFDLNNSWYEEAECNNLVGSAGHDYTVTEPKTFYAKWNANKYYIKYILNSTDASLPSGTADTFEKTYATNITLATPSRLGWTFDGWYKDYTAPDTYNNKYEGKSDLQSASGDALHPVEIYAKWSANTYKIIYNIGTADATAPSAATKTYDSPLTLSNPTNIGDGWTFIDWYKESSLTNPWTGNDDLTSTKGDDQTIYAKWQVKISYNANGHGTAPADTEVMQGESINLPTISDTVEGYTFDSNNSWYKEAEKTNLVGAAGSPYVASKPATLYARWNENEYTITYHNVSASDGVSWATGYTAPTTRLYTREITLPTNADIRRNDGTYDYVFKGWYGTSDFSGDPVIKINANTVGPHNYYAKWYPKYHVTFDMTSYINTLPAEDQFTINVPAPTTQYIEKDTVASEPSEELTASGAEFLGWFTTADCATPFDFTTPITADTTIYAKWQQAITITINFDLKGHGANIDSKYIVDGRNLSRPATPSALGYTFKHWYENDENTEFDFDSTIEIGDGAERTLKAKWEANRYTINFNIGTADATAPDPITKSFASPTTLPNPTTMGAGWIFVGWYKESSLQEVYDGTEDLSAEANVTRTIYAKWKVKVTYDTNGFGTAPAAVEVFQGENITLPTLNNITGWLFDKTNSWYKESACTNLVGAAGSTYKVNAPITLFAHWIDNSSGRSVTPSRNSGNSSSSSGSSSGTGVGPMTNQVRPAASTTISNNRVTFNLSLTRHIASSANNNWSLDSSGKWHVSTLNAQGQREEVRNAWCSYKFTLTNNNISVEVEDFYFIGDDGAVLTGWLTGTDGKTYFLGVESWNQGRMARGWEKIGDKYYFFNTDGTLATNTITPDGYLIDATGAWIK